MYLHMRIEFVLRITHLHTYPTHSAYKIKYLFYKLNNMPYSLYYVLMLKAHHCDLHTMNTNSVFGSRMYGICSSYTLFYRTSR